MKPYPSYKDSGVPARAEQREAGGEWIGEIPSHWNMKKTKYFSTNMDGKRIPLSSEIRGDLEKIYPYYGSNGIIDYVDDFIFDGKHILVGEDGSPFFDRFKDVSLFVDGEFWVNNHCHILKPNNGIEPKYFVHSFNCVDYHEYITGSTRDKLTQSKLDGIVHSFPPLSEQKQIVSFLDTKTQKIDELIEKTEKKIELLKEKRTSLINHCVTKGLNPNVEMKNSGVKWIGEIPSHWVVSKFKYLSKIVTGNTPSKTNEELYYTDSEDGFLWVKPTSLNKGLDYVNESEEHLTEEGKNKIRLIPKDSTMICCIGNTIGKHSISGQELSTNQQINTVIPNQQLLNSWFCLFYVNVFTKDLLKWSNFVTLPIYTKSDLEDTPFILPPIDEQDEIVIKLKSENKFIDSTIEKETQRIDLLKEYRQSLISEVVTGKIDVRDWNS